MPLRLAGLALLVVAPAVAAGPPPLDPEATAPLVWRVVLHVRPHPLLGPDVRARLGRELLATLRPAAAPLAAVEVVDLLAVPRDKWEPLWTRFVADGWPALDAPRDLSGVKTHVVRVDYRDGAYHLEARQHDGFTGLASPAVRRQTVRDATLVGRAIGLMVDRDFAPVGTVEPVPGQPADAVVRFRGGTLAPLDRWVKRGDVFAVAAVRRSARPPAAPPARTATGRLTAPVVDPPPVLTGSRLEYTLLIASDGPRDGAVRCKAVTGYPAPFPAGGGVAGYRCLRLATVAAPFVVRLRDRDGATPRGAAVTVRANDVGFTARPDGGDGLAAGDGRYHSPRPLKDVAFVTVAVGATRAFRFPIAVVGPDPVSLRVDIDPRAEERAAFERECLDLVRRVADVRLAQAAGFDALARLITAGRNDDALARAKGTEAATAADEKEMTAAVARLRDRAALSSEAAGLLGSADRQLGDVRKGQAELAARVADLEGAVAKGHDPARRAKEAEADAAAARVKALVERGHIDEALAAYDALIAAAPNKDELTAQRDRLRAAWTPKSEAHAAARQYLRQTWPGLATIPDLRDGIPEFRSAVATCVAAGDRFTLRGLLPVLGELPGRLAELIRPLDASADADRALLDAAREVKAAAEGAEAEVRAFLARE